MIKSRTKLESLSELRRWMAGRHLRAAYVTNPVSIAYLTGFQANPHERLMALAVRPDDATLIVPALEEEKASKRAADVTVVAWRDGEDAYGLVRNALGGAEEIGVEKEHISLHAAEMITSRTGASELVDIGQMIKRLRLVKQPDEIEKLARAAAITDEVTEALLGRLREGQSEIEVAVIIDELIAQQGVVPSFTSLVQSGPNSALPHLEPSARKLAKGDLVLLDFGAAFHGYKADTTRMAVVGQPSAKQNEIYRVVLEAHDAAIAATKAGVTAGEVDAAARRVIEAAGYGPNFFHRIGHGLGLEGHEDPSMDPGSDRVLETGTVFTVEPGVYIQGFGGVRIEDDVVVEEGGCRVLTNADRTLRKI